MSSGYVANREFVMKKKVYKRGESVDITGLPTLKLEQLLNQRWIQPVEHLKKAAT